MTRHDTDTHATMTLTSADGLKSGCLATISVESTDRYTARDGRPIYRWTVEVGPTSYGLKVSATADDLNGPAAGPAAGPEPSPRAMLASLLTFLGAALDAVAYTERTGRPSDNADLFPAALLAALAAAEVNADTLAIHADMLTAEDEDEDETE